MADQTIWTPEQRKRLTVMKAEIEAQLEAAQPHLCPSIRGVLAGIRAGQLLREIVEPGWRARIEIEQACDEMRAVRADMLRAGWPSFAIDALVTGHDGAGHPLVLSEAERELRRMWGQGKRRTVALVGVVGTGKTLAACRVFSPETTRYLTARDFLAHSDRTTEGLQWQEGFTKRPIILLDEIGRPGERPEDIDRLAGWVQRRHDDLLTTVLLANITEKEFSTRYTASLLSRMWDAGGIYACTNVLRPGEQRRLELVP